LQNAIAQKSQLPSTSAAPEQKLVQPDYDLDAAAEMFAAVFPDREPREVLREHGLAADLELEMDEEESSSDEEQAEDDRQQGEGADQQKIPKNFLFLAPPGTSKSHEESEGPAESPIPEDPHHTAAEISQQQLAQRSRWRRVLRTALPLQVGQNDWQYWLMLLLYLFKQCWCFCWALPVWCRTVMMSTAVIC